jgi:hypothetical protein
LPITNRDEKIIYRSVIPLADLLYVCQLHFVSFRFFIFRFVSLRGISFRFVSFSFLSLVVPKKKLSNLCISTCLLKPNVATLLVEMSLYSDTLSRFKDNHSLLLFLNTARVRSIEAVNVNFIMFDLTRQKLETTIHHHTGSEHNHSTIDAVLIQTIDKSNVRYYRYVWYLTILYIISISVITLVYVVSGYSQSVPSIGYVCQDGCHVCFKNEYDDLIKLPVKKTGVCDGTS